MNYKILVILVIFLSTAAARAQGDPSDIVPILSQPLQSREVVTFQLQQFLLQKTPKLPDPQSAEHWTNSAEQIRQHLLKEIIFHGWPQEWVNSQPRFEDLGRLPSGKGYQVHKLRYEVVPGFYATALLYEPEHLSGKDPAVLNLMGHFAEQGNTVAFEQQFCINQALRGMIALNPDWVAWANLM